MLMSLGCVPAARAARAEAWFPDIDPGLDPGLPFPLAEEAGDPLVYGGTDDLDVVSNSVDGDGPLAILSNWEDMLFDIEEVIAGPDAESGGWGIGEAGEGD